MIGTKNESLQPQSADNAEKPGGETKIAAPGQLPAQESRTAAPVFFRKAGYVVLLLAAVFMINAMETGSFRTPWPVAIAVALLGFVLLGFSCKRNTGHDQD